MSDDIKMKASTVYHTLQYLRKSEGDAVFESLLSSISALHQDAIRNATVASWIDIKSIYALLDAIKYKLGKNDPCINHRVGLEATKKSFSRIYKMFFRVGKPDFVIQRTAVVWGTMATKGRVEVLDSGTKYVDIALFDFEHSHREFCTHRLRGNFQAVLEVSGCKILESKHTRCRLDGHDQCEWLYTWY